MYRYNIEKIIDRVNNIKLSKKDKLIALLKNEYSGPILYGIFILIILSIAIPCFSIYVIGSKSIISWIFSTVFLTFITYYYLLFSKKDIIFHEKSKKYIICKEEIDEYITSLPEKYKEDVVERLADRTWSDGGNLSAKSFIDVYNYFLPSITGLNKKIFKDDFVTSFIKKEVKNIDLKKNKKEKTWI